MADDSSTKEMETSNTCVKLCDTRNVDNGAWIVGNALEILEILWNNCDGVTSAHQRHTAVTTQSKFQRSSQNSKFFSGRGFWDGWCATFSGRILSPFFVPFDTSVKVGKGHIPSNIPEVHGYLLNLIINCIYRLTVEEQPKKIQDPIVLGQR